MLLAAFTTELIMDRTKARYPNDEVWPENKNKLHYLELFKIIIQLINETIKFKSHHEVYWAPSEIYTSLGLGVSWSNGLIGLWCRMSAV